MQLHTLPFDDFWSKSLFSFLVAVGFEVVDLTSKLCQSIGLIVPKFVLGCPEGVYLVCFNVRLHLVEFDVPALEELLAGDVHASLGAWDKAGCSALHHAAQVGRAQAASRLCAAGADVLATDARGCETPLENVEYR